MSDWRELAERAESADGPDRVIDGLIWAWLKGDDPYIVGNEPGRFPQKAIYGTRADLMNTNPTKDIADYICAPAYTASLDEAITLVPPTHRPYSADFSIAGRFCWMLISIGPIYEEDEGNPFPCGVGVTPALALCAAALRARAPA